MTSTALSPVVDIYSCLRSLNASWAVHVGRPADAPGWVHGEALTDAFSGSFNDLLRNIGERAKTSDKRTIAASFCLRYGWASAMAIAPYLRYHCVPDVALANISLKFKESTFFERTAIHEPRGVMVTGDPRAAHPSIAVVASNHELVRELRRALADQATPVVESLYQWSGFARRGSWGMITSSWASQFTGLSENRRDHREVWPDIDALFAGEDIVAAMRPLMHAVTFKEHTHLYQRRASCCRYYLLPQGDLCASCPLVSHEERLARNQEWMQQQIERVEAGPGHS
jgi:hypothetical protein